MIQFLSRQHEVNAGDRASNPLLYFQFQDQCATLCIHELFEKSFYDSKLPLIVGGGGLNYWESKLEKVSRLKRAPVVIWGMGLNGHGRGPADSYPAFYRNFDMVGVRDFGFSYPFVPCVSCLHPKLKKFTAQAAWRDVVYFLHHESPDSNPNLFPSMNNAQSVDEIIPFLASAETVVTNTYHGFYWATLLGKRVVVVPLENSSRFHFFPFRPIFAADFDEAREMIGRGQQYPESLERCRERNLSFATEVSLFLNCEIKVKGGSIADDSYCHAP